MAGEAVDLVRSQGTPSVDRRGELEAILGVDGIRRRASHGMIGDDATGGSSNATWCNKSMAS